VASYRQLLVPGDDTFVVWTLHEVIAAFAMVATADEMPWVDAFRMRYLALEQSEGAWKGRR